MLHNILLFSTFFIYVHKIRYNHLFLQMPSFEKNCGYKPSKNTFLSILNDMQLCINGYYPHSIIINKNKIDAAKNYYIFNVICSKKKLITPEIIFRL